MRVWFLSGVIGLSLGQLMGRALAAGPSLHENFDAPLDPAVWGRIDETYAVADGKLVAFDGGTSQADRYLLTTADYGDFLLEFTLTRTGQASGAQERAQVVYAIAEDDVAHRRFIWLDAGGDLPVGQPVRVTVIVRDGEATLLFDGAGTGRRTEVVGKPGLTGRVGFLHYFNYAFAYDDLTLTPLEPARDNLATQPGVVAVADSTHRDRWGVDGYHAANVHDGQLGGPATAQWVSDNWEVTHTVGLVFPRRVTIREVRLHWGGQAPRRYTLEAQADKRWRPLVEVREGSGSPISVHPLAEGVTADAVRLVVPPVGAGLRASPPDRRVSVAEFEVLGEPVEPAQAVDVEAVGEALRAELRALREREDAARVAPLLEVVMRSKKPRGFMGIIDAADAARGRANAASRPWAKALAATILKDADWWVAQTDDYVYNLIPVGNPRALCPQFEKGCPLHGGARGSFDTTLETPYRWRCRKGGEEWYDGAEVTNPTTGEKVVVHDDGSGWLAPAGFPNAGRRYFFVAAYRYFLLGKLFSSPYEPDRGDAGYQGGTPVVQLALAYALTGDARYAHTAAVMLNRLAELYRTYDGCVEGPSQRQDGYIGQTFERFLVQNLILACDLIWDALPEDAALREFFAAKGNADYDGDGQVTGADIPFHLQRNLLGYVYEYLHRLMPYFDGDFLMYEMTALAALAHVLGNGEMAQEVLESDVGLRVMLTNSWFRDGKFIYDSASYNVGNARTPLLIAEWLHGLVAPPQYPPTPPLTKGGPGGVDTYNHPDYRMSALFDFLRHIDCDGRLPQIGDGGGSRGKSLRLTPPYDPYDERALLRLPGQRAFYAARLLAAADGDLEAFRQGRADWWLLFHAEEGEEIRQLGNWGIRQLGNSATQQSDNPKTGMSAPVAPFPGGPIPRGPRCPTTHTFPDSGITILRAGSDPATRLHVPITYSKGQYGHGHPDKLAINLIRFGYDLSADLGYPTTWTDPKASGWETNTASHCLVVLDERGQAGNQIGQLHFEARSPLVDAVEASCEGAYPQASLYRRTVALVRRSTPPQPPPSQGGEPEGEPLYTVDVFRVAGGATRDYLFHSLGPPEGMTVDLPDGAAAWTKQERGSLAGEDVEPMTQGGYGFLFNVERAATDGRAIAGWRVPDEDPPVGLRLHLLGRPGREIIRAQAEGYGVRGQSPLEGHFIARDRFDNATEGSAFVAVLDVYQGSPIVEGVAPIPLAPAEDGVAGLNAVGLRVEAGERVDYVFSALDADTERTAEADGLRFTFRGRFGLAATMGGEVVGLTVVGGGQLGVTEKRGNAETRKWGSSETERSVHPPIPPWPSFLISSPGDVRGEVVRTDVENPAVLVRLAPGSPPPSDAHVGQLLLIHNDAYVCPAVYEITSVQPAEDGLWRLGLNLPLVVARGVVGSVNEEAGSFASRTPVMKLRVNPGLFDGKRVRPRATNDAPEHVLRAAREAAFVLADAAGLADFPVDGEYVVLDVGTGDAVEIVSVAALAR